MSFRKIFSRRAHVSREVRIPFDRHDIAADLDLFLKHNHVGRKRYRRTRHHVHTLSAPDGAGVRAAGPSRSYNAEFLVSIGG